MPIKPQVTVEPRPDGRWAVQTDTAQRADSLHDRNNLPGFFGRLISGKMALRREGRADEKESIQRRANGRDPARS